MNLETQIKSDLWAAVQHSYGSGNYTHAIRDAMTVVTDVVRDKSGLDGDGDKLVGQALGFSKGKQPRIKVNKLQTETEQDVQKGLMLVLKGMYALVRNPRSHERLDDDKHTADTIILFIDYLLDFLGRSQHSYTVQALLDMVTDPYFVSDPEYVKGLVDTIPSRKQGDTLIALYRSNNWKQADNFEPVIKELLSRVTEGVVEDFLSVISEDLQRVDDVGAVTLVIKILPDELWPRIERMPRLRVEKMLLNELETAWYVPDAKRTNSNASTWISRIARHYLRKHLLRAVIVKKLRAKDFDQHNFVARFFLGWSVLPEVFKGERQVKECVAAICHCIESGNEFVKDRLLESLRLGLSEEWDKEFIENLSDLTDPDFPEIYLSDGTPLLGKFTPRPNPASGGEEIPF